MSSNPVSREQQDEAEEEIYWLRPKVMSSHNSPGSEASERVNWSRKTKQKVTFDNFVKKVPVNENIHRDDDDDGDYARLRELSLVVEPPTISPEKINCLQDQEDAKYCYSPTLMNMKNIDDHRLSHSSENEEVLVLPPPPPPLPPEMNEESAMTPRCLLRADSGVPTDLTPKSESEPSPSLPDHSETSSGIHSNSSRESNNAGVKGPGSNEDIFKHLNQGKSVKIASLNNRENEPRELFIHRLPEKDVISVASSPHDQFERSTNMRMISFSDSYSATLPHFPTQDLGKPYPHCSTMPLPPVLATPQIQPVTNLNFPRHHTTIPTHHNGIRLFNSIYAKRLNIHRYPPQHMSFPFLSNGGNKYVQINEERDSANVSMTSSNHSDSYT